MATTSGKKKDAVILYKESDGEYISIPVYDKLGNSHQGAAINGERFEPGKTYYVSPEIAEELTRILTVFDEQTIGLLLSRVNKRALQQLRHLDFDSIEQ